MNRVLKSEQLSPELTEADTHCDGCHVPVMLVLSRHDLVYSPSNSKLGISTSLLNFDYRVFQVKQKTPRQEDAALGAGGGGGHTGAAELRFPRQGSSLDKAS